MWGWSWLENLLQDIQYGFRMLSKNPGFAAVAILTLTLGIGANTALFSVVNGVLLNPLPYPDPEQLVTLHESKPNFDSGSISFPNFRDWQKNNQTFSAMAIARGYSPILTGRGEPEQVNARFVTSDFFSILGVKPILGRGFGPGEDEIGAAGVALVSEGFWKRKLGGSPDALGQVLALDTMNLTIVGVIPASFDLRINGFRTAEVYIPVGQWTNPALKSRMAGLAFHGIGRLKPGVTIQQARADMERVTRGLEAAYPNINKNVGASMFRFREALLGGVRPLLLVLFGAVGFVLLIACVNVANLLLARSTARMRELAIRSALGAGRARLIRQMLTESILLALMGGGLGLLVAQWATGAALGALPFSLPRTNEVHLDSHVLLFTAAVSVLAGILFGMVPALRISHQNVHETLKEGGRGGSGLRHRIQGVFVAVEMALAVVLLIGAGLMMRSLAALWNVDPGFQPDHTLALGVSLSQSLSKESPDAIRAAFRELDRKIASTPGVEAVSLSWSSIPILTDDEALFWMYGQPKPKSMGDMNWALKYDIEPDYLKVMKIPLRRGRFLEAQDNEHAPSVTVIDETFARKYFPNQDPIGQRVILAGPDRPVEIVGVVAHVKQWSISSDEQLLQAQMYLPYMQLPDSAMQLSPGGSGVVLRTNREGPGLLDSIRSSVRDLTSQPVLYGAQTMKELIAASFASRQFSMIILGVFAGLALLLSSIGIYGVISYVVGQRTQEIGIRVALGAQRRDVFGLILGHGLRLTLIGVAVGLAAAFGLTRLMITLLFGVKPTDPLTFVGVAAILSAVALTACFIPARRAMRVDPAIALRHE